MLPGVASFTTASGAALGSDPLAEAAVPPAAFAGDALDGAYADIAAVSFASGQKSCAAANISSFDAGKSGSKDL